MSFQKELKEIKEFFYISHTRYILSHLFLENYKATHTESNDASMFNIADEEGNIAHNATIGKFKTTRNKHIRILINNCIILLISLWEIYCKKNKIDKYYNPEIREIILYRNCIVHNKGIIDRGYITNSKLNKYKLGDVLNFSEKDLKEFLKYFEGK